LIDSKLERDGGEQQDKRQLETIFCLLEVHGECCERHTADEKLFHATRATAALMLTALATFPTSCSTDGTVARCISIRQVSLPEQKITFFANHRLNGSSSSVLTATCLSYGRLCDFLGFFSRTDLEVTPLDRF